jgi:type I restriction enzyme S subunit
MHEWRRVRLHEVADEVTVGHVGPMVDEYRSSGIPFLRSQNVLPHRIDLSDVKFIDGDFHLKLKKSALRPGDVVTVRTGKPGTTSVVPDSLLEANCSDLVITRPGPALDARWLSYYINEAASDYVSAHLVGAVQQHFNVGSAKSMVLNLPPLNEQQAIAGVLGALDDKTAANARAEELMEQLIGALHLHAAEAPGHKAVPLFEVFDVDFGEAFKGDHFSKPGIGRPLIRIRDLKTFSSQIWTTETRVRESVIQPGEVVVGMDAEFRPTWWLGEPGLLNQRVCRVRGRSLGAAFSREALCEPLMEIEGYKTATTVIHLNKRDLDRVRVTVPSVEALSRFEAAAEPLLKSRVSLAAERKVLATMRDALLPQLMSGKIRVMDAEQTLGEVV